MPKILVVEDSASTRSFVRSTLESENGVADVEVVEAVSGFDALRLLPRGPYDLVITDINMPDINGLELVQFMRKSELHRATPILLISTQSSERDRQRGLRLGANGYLAKPFGPERSWPRRTGTSARAKVGRVAEQGDRARDEFLSEAQEIVETLSRNLLSLDASVREGAADPELVNESFRAVHTLKGLAGLFGAQRLATLSHRLEDLLDDLRLGRAPLGRDARRAVQRRRRLRAPARERARRQGRAHSGGGRPARAARSARRQAAPKPTPVSEYELDPGLLGVLTEYEEHRLRTNIEQKLRLYRLRVQFDLSTIDKALEDMKGRAKQHGEIITYLPTGEAASPDAIELDLLMASRDDLATLIGSLGAENVVIEEIPRRRATGDAEHRGTENAAATAWHRKAGRLGAPTAGSGCRTPTGRACARSRRRCASTSASSTT